MSFLHFLCATPGINPKLPKHTTVPLRFLLFLSYCLKRNGDVSGVRASCRTCSFCLSTGQLSSKRSSHAVYCCLHMYVSCQHVCVVWQIAYKERNALSVGVSGLPPFFSAICFLSVCTLSTSFLRPLMCMFCCLHVFASIHCLPIS